MKEARNGMWRPNAMQRSLAWCLLLALGAAFAACSGGQQAEDASLRSDAASVFPASYKADILAMLRVYLNDPTNVRDAGVSEPFLQAVGGRNRYAVCVRLSAKKLSGEYSPTKSHIAYFAAGRLDQMIEANRDQCDAAAYLPFPEAEKLSR